MTLELSPLNHRCIEEATERLTLIKKWSVPIWVKYQIDTGRTLVKVKASMVRDRIGWHAVMQSVKFIGKNNEPVCQNDVRKVATLLPGLAPKLLGDHVEVVKIPGERFAKPPKDFERELRKLRRGDWMKQIDREDSTLRLWETKYEPQGLNQTQAAKIFGLAPSTFRTYLSHARARRDGR